MIEQKTKELGGKILTLALVLTLLFSLASGNDYEPQEKNPLWKEFMEGASDSIIYFVGNFARRVLLVYASFTPEIKETGELTYGNLEKYLLSNPQPSGKVLQIISYFISILEPLYVAAIILIGIYLIFLSSSPRGRARAKSYLLRLILSMVLISITPAIVRLLFSLSNGLTQSILSLGPPNLIQLHKNSIFYSLRIVQKAGVASVIPAIPFLLFSFLLTTGAFLILAVRYLMVLLLISIFPLAIFLFSFKPTKNIGRILLSQLFFWIFLPVSLAIALVAIATGENLFHQVLAELWNFALGGTLALILSPIGMFFATKGAIKVIEKISHKFSGVEKRIIPELEEAEKRKISEKEAEAELKEISKQGKINHKDLQERKKLYQQLQKEAQEREESVEELLREKYNYELISEKEVLKKGVTRRKIGTPLEKAPEEGYAPTTPVPGMPTPKKEKPKPEIKKELRKRKKAVVVELGVRVKPTSTSSEIERGTDKEVEVEVENLTDSVLHEIQLMDQELRENNILVSYSENKFSLSPGETKSIMVKIRVMEGAEPKTYEGTILVKCKEGFKNFIDVEINVKRREEEEKKEKERKEEKEEKKEPRRIKPVQKVKEPEEAPSELPPKVKASLVRLSNVEGEINYAQLQKPENAQLRKNLQQAAKEEGKTLKEFVQDEYGLRVVEEMTQEEICKELSQMANIENEINPEQLRLKEKLYEQVSKKAEEEDKSVPEYVKEKCGLKVLGEEEEEEREKPTRVKRKVTPAAAPKEPPKKVKEEKEEKKEEEKLAPPAPEAPPKVISP